MRLETAELRLSPHRANGSVPRRLDLPPRGVLHTTETDAGTAEAVRKNLQWPYHLLVDVYLREVLQILLDLGRTAFSLRSWNHADVPRAYQQKHPFFETNHAGRHNVQIALIGRAKDMHTLTTNELQWLVDTVLWPVSKMLGIPNHWQHPTRPELVNYPLASVWSPLRLNGASWETFSGWTTHQGVGAQDHWDPGGLNTRMLQQMLERKEHKPMDQWWQDLVNLPEGGKHPYVETKRLLVNALIRAKIVPGPLAVAALGSAHVDDAELRAAWQRYEETFYGKGAPGVNATPGPSSWPRAIALVMETMPRLLGDVRRTFP